MEWRIKPIISCLQPSLYLCRKKSSVTEGKIANEGKIEGSKVSTIILTARTKLAINK
jgi:hypothetical protein